MNDMPEKVNLEKRKIEQSKNFVINLCRVIFYTLAYFVISNEIPVFKIFSLALILYSVFWLALEMKIIFNYDRFKFLRYIPATADLLFVFLIIYLTGGLNSIITGFVLALIGVSVVLSSDSFQSVYILTVSIFLYTVLGLLLYFNKITYVNVFNFGRDPPYYLYLLSGMLFYISTLAFFFAISGIAKKNIALTKKLEEFVQMAENEKFSAISDRNKYESLAESRKKLSLVGQMVAGIVHDIKNPMTTIKALAEMANSDQISKQTRMKNLILIVREMDRLNDLAYEILDFSKGKLNLDLKIVNIEDFLQELELFIAIDFKYRNIEFIQDLEFTGNVRIDKDRIRRVIINIANNAIEAMYESNKNYTFTIQSRVRGNEVILSLIDNGPGLPETMEERIFEAFATEGKEKGTGLGLFMSKWIVEAHNGKLTYETKKGKGTTFYIALQFEEI